MPQWYTPMDYMQMGQQIAEPIAAEMRQRRAGRIAQSLMETGDFSNPDIARPGVAPALGAMMRMKEFQDSYPLEQQMRQFKFGQAVNAAGQGAAMHQAKMETERNRAAWYEARANNPTSGYQGKKYTGNTGNLMQLAEDLSDAQEELARIQQSPDPDPDMQAMKLNRAQNRLETVRMTRELALKKFEKEGMSSSAKVSIAPDKEGKNVVKISGPLNDPEIQKHMQQQQESDAFGKLGFMDKIGSLVSGAVNAAQPQAPSVENAPVAKPVGAPPPGATPEAVREAFRAGKITREEAKAALAQFGFQ